MIRALVRTTTEAAGTDFALVADALRVLFRLFRQSQNMCACMLSVEFVRRAKGEAAESARERRTLAAMQRAISSVVQPLSTEMPSLVEGRSTALKISQKNDSRPFRVRVFFSRTTN